MGWRQTFDAIESGAASNVESVNQPLANNALGWIDSVIRFAIEEAPEGITLDGSDPAERVAEALAVWIKESAPRRFADMTGTRYTVSGLDCSADGMERLRDQSEFILLAYPSAETTPADLLDSWLEDIDLGDAPESDYDAAHAAVRQWVADATESGYLAQKLAERSEFHSDCVAEEPDKDSAYFESIDAFRLYVRDNAPESDA